MKKRTQSMLSLVLALMLAMTMCLAGGAGAVYADAEAEAAAMTDGVGDAVKAGAGIDDLPALYDGGTLSVTNLNSATEYAYKVSSSGTYAVTMPEKGILAVTAVSESGTPYVTVKDSNNATVYTSYSYSDDTTGACYFFYSCGKGKYSVTVSVGAKTAIEAQYAPNSAQTIGLKKIVFRGNGGSSSAKTTFKVKVPSTGYLKVNLADTTGDPKHNWPVYAKTNGYKDFESFNSTDNVKWIGVKKGTYTFTVKTYAPVYGVNVEFTKVKEAKYGTKKKKAAKLTKKKIYKGLIITNKKKAHWYKFKNPKTQKVNVVLKSKFANGNYSGGFRVTAYYGKASTWRIIKAGTGTTKIQLYNKGKKLRKGTYYLKVESYNGGTGYYTIQWK